MEKEYWALFRKRLGLKTGEPSDADKLVQPLLNLLQTHKLDFHGTLRRLCFFRPTFLSSDSTDRLRAFVASLASNSFELQADDVDATKDWCEWLAKYAERIDREIEAGVWSQDTGGTPEVVWERREREMRHANPRFVLRQWLLEETIKRVQDDVGTGKRALAKVHEMASNPYEAWGAENDGRSDSELSDEEKEERRFCGLGSKKFIGFQCSCSS
ncbi:hypothetical protein M0805_003007 [Coniferiporia weirii]|nr:hypothetical protein M0805_003007 [Coniferiporia weirii]